MKVHQDNFDAEIISIVAHDLRTPVSAAKGFIELMEQVGPLNERQHHFSDRAMAALVRMEQLIANLLDYARLEGGIALQPVSVDLRALIADATEMLEEVAAKRGITIHNNVEEPVIVSGDARLLAQVVTNLLTNAVKYNRDDGDIWVTTTAEQNLARIDVRDTGIGIPQDDVSRVFERFFRSRSGSDRKVEGSGLGLAITRAIVELHEGEIWVDSIPDEGSTFSFTLPLKEQAEKLTARDGGFSLLRGEPASEQADAIDDDSQDSHEDPESDSKSDEQ